ncbi:response regulator [Pseudohongiella spirulinae]|uniref:Two component transcriptional regulator, LuxR family n=1 Tax=Pseudohongiella spirulinae TaxID=1249552 RepID=A0A0S2KA78_9GAMM|nr:response regulator transcription factor [Pseudohongiella spirulinae]ALO45276.1 Two component transcriptional regulator, LuxR family [Pseudohongiella spirulinae]
MIKVFVVDDHEIVRQGICRMLECTPDFELAGQAADGWNLVEKVLDSGANLLVMDMNMPGPESIDLIADMHKRAPDVPVLVLSMVDDVQVASAALKAGALGYLTKNSDSLMIVQAIRQCLEGNGYIQPELGARMIQAAGQQHREAPHKTLSSREKQIFLLIANGMSINQISEKLHISPKTVSTHKFRIMQKLALSNTSELVRYAIRHRVIEA